VLAPGGSYYLREYLIELRETEAFKYRPILIYLENKGHRSNDNRWGEDLSDDDLLALVEKDFEVFDNVLTPELLGNGDLPPVSDLAGWAIPIDVGGGLTPTGTFVFPENKFPAPNPPEDCGQPQGVRGRMIEDGASPRVWRLNNLTDDWTFSFGAPPNPLVVDPDAREETLVPRCGGEDVARRARRQGTRLLPVASVADAVSRARETISYSENGTNFTDLMMGIGFTALVAPGTYRERLHINFSFTIRADSHLGRKNA
jgi:hypothetical protein